MKIDTCHDLTKRRNKFEKKKTGFTLKLSVTAITGNHRELCRVKQSPYFVESDYQLLGSRKLDTLKPKYF
jgi:hypothetical protein